MDQWPVTSQELSLATGAGLLLSLPGYGGTLVVPFCLSAVTLNECLNLPAFWDLSQDLFDDCIEVLIPNLYISATPSHSYRC